MYLLGCSWLRHFHFVIGQRTSERSLVDMEYIKGTKIGLLILMNGMTDYCDYVLLLHCLYVQLITEVCLNLHISLSRFCHLRLGCQFNGRTRHSYCEKGEGLWISSPRWNIVSSIVIRKNTANIWIHQSKGFHKTRVTELTNRDRLWMWKSIPMTCTTAGLASCVSSISRCLWRV